MKINSFSSLFLISLFSYSNSTFKRENLNQLVPNITEINSVIQSQKQKKGKQSNNTTPQISPQEFLQLKEKSHDVQELIMALESNQEPRGYGATGSVFMINSSFGQGVFGEAVPRVMKVMQVRNRMHVDDLKMQDSLMQEINVMEDLKQIPNFNLFFPEYFFSADVTEPAHKLLVEQEQNLSKSIKDIIRVTGGSRLVALEMEKLSFNLNQYSKGVQAKSLQGVDIQNQVKMAINLFQALALLNQNYIHCDIKSSNVMIKILEYSGAVDLINSYFHVVEEKAGYMFLVKLIDFGISQRSDEGACQGGTPGFIAPEYFNQKSHKNFDVFSMGVMLIDMELYSFQKQNLSGVLSKVFVAKSDLEYRNGEFQNFLKTNDLVKELLLLLGNQQVSNKYRVFIAKQAVFQRYVDKEIDLQKILEADMNVLELTLIHLTFVLLNKKREEGNADVDRMQEQLLKSIEQMISQIEQHPEKNAKGNVNGINYVGSNFSKMFLEKQLHENYYKVLERAVTWEADERPSANELFETLSKNYKEFFAEYEEYDILITKYEMSESDRDTISTNLLSSIIGLEKFGLDEMGTIANDMRNSNYVDANIETCISQIKYLL